MTVLVWGEASIMLAGMEAARRAGGEGVLCMYTALLGGFLGIRRVGF